MNVIKNIYGSLMPLLAPQSGAFRIGAYRVFHPNSSTFEHLSLYKQKHLGQSVACLGHVWGINLGMSGTSSGHV